MERPMYAVGWRIESKDVLMPYRLLTNSEGIIVGDTIDAARRSFEGIRTNAKDQLEYIIIDVAPLFVKESLCKQVNEI